MVCASRRLFFPNCQCLPVRLFGAVQVPAITEYISKIHKRFGKFEWLRRQFIYHLQTATEVCLSLNQLAATVCEDAKTIPKPGESTANQRIFRIEPTGNA